MNKKSYIVTGIIVVLVIGGLFVLGIKTQNTAPDTKYDSFAQCLKDKGLTFYGAFWCPHCREQKAEFGDSVHLLPYHECSTPDGKSMTQDCQDKGIKGYPTWIYPDKTIEEGVQSLQHLSEKSGCPLPQ